MTAIINRPVTEAPDNVVAGAAPTDSLLRFALRADATLCSALGLLVAMAADPLSRLSDLSSTSEWIGGAALVAYGVLLSLASPTSGASASACWPETSPSRFWSPSYSWRAGCR